MDRGRLDAALRSSGLYDRAREVLATLRPGENVFDALARSGLSEAVAQALHSAGIDPATLSSVAPASSTTSPAVSASTTAAGPARTFAAGSLSAMSVSASHRATVAPPAGAEASSPAVHPSRRYLQVDLQGGRAFLGHLDAEFAGDFDDSLDGDAGHADAAPRRRAVSRYYVLHTLLRGQRFSTPLVPVSVSPSFSGSYLFDLSLPEGADGTSEEEDAKDSKNLGRLQAAALQPLRSLLPTASGNSAPGSSARDPSSLASHANTVLQFVLTVVTSRTYAASSSSSTSDGDSDSAQEPIEEVQVDVVASHALDWRTVVSHDATEAATTIAGGAAAMECLVPLSPAGPGPHSTAADGAPIPAGLLQVSLSLAPSPSPSELVPRVDVDFLLAAERRRLQDAGRAYFTYAKGWWTEYRSLHPSFRRRAVKLFGENERGEWHPLPSYVTPLIGGRGLESPAHAARFVSLLPYRRQEGVIGGTGGAASAREVWTAPHVTLLARQGDVQAHAVLLACLLLGFGLEAYVVIGTRPDPEAPLLAAQPGGGAGEGGFPPGSEAGAPAPPATATSGIPEMEYTWVMTRSGTPSRNGSSGIVFWDPLTAARSSPCDTDPLTGLPLWSRLACAFNHEAYYANHALDDRVAALRWDAGWDDIAQWKPIEPAVLCGLPHAPVVPLAPPSLNGEALSVAIEAALKASIARLREGAAHELSRLRRVAARARDNAGLPPLPPRPGSSPLAPAHGVSWDAALEYRLQPGLAAYETQRLHGIAAGADDFAAAIRRTVPSGCAFHAFPLVFNHLSPGRMLETLLASPVARGILLDTPSDEGGHTVFALRCKVTPYLEDTTAAWVMLACVAPVSPATLAGITAAAAAAAAGAGASGVQG